MSPHYQPRPSFLVDKLVTLFIRLIKTGDLLADLLIFVIDHSLIPSVRGAVIVNFAITLLVTTPIYTFIQVCILVYLYRLDYCGIALLTVGSFVPWLYYSFYCRLEPKITYLALIFYTRNHMYNRINVGQVRRTKV